MHRLRDCYRLEVTKERFSKDVVGDKTAMRELARRGGFHVLDVADVGPAEARVSQYSNLSLGHVRTTPMTLLWDRSERSRHRSFMAVAVSGDLQLSSDGGCVVRGERAVFIPPGNRPVHLSTLGPRTEFVFIVAGSDIVPPGLRELTEPLHAGPVAPERLEPIHAFVKGICGTPAPRRGEADWLMSSAASIAGACAQILAEGLALNSGLYRRAIQHIELHHADTTLAPATMSQRLGVRPRTLQAAFAVAGTSMSAELRAARLRAYSRLRESSPDAAASELASRSGFSSVPTMYRAIRAERFGPG